MKSNGHTILSLRWPAKLWSRATIQVKFLSLVIPLVLLCMVGTTIIMGNFAQNQALDRESDNFGKIGLATTEVLADAFWNYNLSQTDAIMQSLKLIPDLVAAKAMEIENGSVLEESALNRTIIVSQNTGRFIRSQTFPIIYHHEGIPNRLGSFEITYSLQALATSTRRQSIIAIFASLFSGIALVIGAALALSRLILRPVEAVARSSRSDSLTDEALAQAEFIPIVWNTNDQIGTMVHAYNQLRKRQSQYAIALSEQKALQALEGERQRITMELHDGLGGTLVSLLARIENAPDIKRETLAVQLQESINELGTIMDTLESDGNIDVVLAQIRRRIEPILDDFGVTLTWTINDTIGVPEPGPTTASHIARITQEAITNALRHAQASNICVQMTGETLSISDNGCGIPPDHQKGRGLQTMKVRASKIGLNFQIETSTGGTHITLRR